MPKIVPDAHAAANSHVPRRLADAFRAEVDKRVEDGDFARREEVALTLANEVVRGDLTAALMSIVASHGTEDVLVGDERYRLHETGSQSYASFVGALEVERLELRLHLRLRSNYFVNAFGPHVTSRLPLTVARHYRRAPGTLAWAWA